MKRPYIPQGLEILALLFFQALASHATPTTRQIIPLDSTWQIAEGGNDKVPAAFDHKVVVPGLVDMAQPPFVEPGPKVAARSKIPQKDPRRDAFWYRRTFTVSGPLPAVATLKINKAMFGTRVLLNGTLLGEHAACFTPGLFDAKGALKAGTNELIVRVGADRDAVGRVHPDGFDFEKERYIPGIFDSVTLTLSGAPHIENVQVAPDLSNRQARVRIWLKHAAAGDVTVEVREAKSKRVAGTAAGHLTDTPEQVLDLAVPVPTCHVWSPEDPFLYEISVRTAGDEVATRFGMREFKLDPVTGRALLNGKPYFLRGSNITLYRFFEDPERGDLPWDQAWVRLLHQRVKDMHWNCLRYCIGFPPEAWYDIADEAGILIQDEFPIWFGGDVPKEMQVDELAQEYAEWMRARWNHPCVAIWDACNETLSPKTGAALKQVRALDLSNRPWDNGYSSPQEPGDSFESHPYHFSNPGYKLSQLATANPVPQGNRTPNDGQHAIVINEYGWLWLNRDGTPTTLTEKLYANLLGTNATTAQRRQLYARYTAAETEFWRGHRTVAAVLHFTTLGYSRPDGQTSDHWRDIRKLTWDPDFNRYVRDAFAPVGVMLDAWAEDYPSGKSQEFPAVVINDRETPWKGYVQFQLMCNGKATAEQTLPAEVAGFGTNRVIFTVAIPEQAGDYQAEATLLDTPDGPVHSVRAFAVRSPEEIAARLGLAVGKPVTASSTLVKSGATAPEAAVDGRTDTRWSSEFSDPQWLAVDLGAPTQISRVELVWEAAHGKSYAIQVSPDGQQWTDVYKTDAGKGGTETIRFAPVTTRWVRFYGTKRATNFGYSLWELRVFP